MKTRARFIIKVGLSPFLSESLAATAPGAAATIATATTALRIALPVVALALALALVQAPTAEARVSFELIGGGLTYHVVDYGTAQFYSNKVSADGRLIANLIYGVGLNFSNPQSENYVALRGFKGNNSINQPINGGTFSVGHSHRHLDFGIVIGGYIQNNDNFDNTGIVPFSVNTGTNAFVPIFGIELNPKITFGNTFFLKMNNIFTPSIFNFSLSLGANL